MTDQEKTESKRANWRAASLRWKLAHPEQYKVSHTASNLRWRKKNPAKCLKNAIKWAKANPDKHRASGKKARDKWRRNNPDRVRELHRSWVDKNRDKHNARERHRHATDPVFRVGKALRGRIRSALRSTSAKRHARATVLVGCDLPFLLTYLSAQFKPDMTWENYGALWEIDHRKPCSSFNLTQSEEQLACFHYSNLQPLYVTENRQKYNKFLATSDAEPKC